MTEAVREYEKLKGKNELLVYLLDVANGTNGAEVWRSLFAEMRANTLGRMKDMLELEEKS